MRRFFSGIRAYAPAWRMLFLKKFAWFLLFPVLVLVLLFMGGNMLTGYWGESLYDWSTQKVFSWVEGIPWLHWLDDVAGWLVWLLVRLIYFLLFAAFSGYVVVIVMSPVYSWLSERAETHLTGREYTFSISQLMRDMVRGVLIALRNMLIQTALTVVLFFVSFIPVVGLLSPVLLLLVSAYFYGFSFMDYAIERKRLNVRDSVRYVNRNVGETTGVGFIFAVALMVPFLNILVCSFLSLVSVLAGTVVVNNRDNRLASGMYKMQ